MIEVETRCEFVDLKAFKVGEHQKLLCHFDRPTPLTAPFKIKFADEKDTYALVVLDAVSSEKELQLLVTGYKPGSYKNVGFEILSGETHLVVAPLSWDITATVQQNSQQNAQQSAEQQPQPTPSYGPFMLPFPSWILWSAGVLLLAVILTAVYSYLRRRHKKAFQKELDAYLHKGAPHNQAHTALRSLIRLMDSEQKSKPEVLNEMNTVLRQYLMGTFAMPTENLTAAQLLKKLHSRSEKWSKDLKIQFRQFVFDIERLLEQKEVLSQEDLLDLAFRMRRLIDQVQFQRGRQ